MTVSISHVSFEHHVQPLGIGEAKPRISWQFEGDASNWTQSGYTIEVTRGGRSQLFEFTSPESVLVPWPTVALSSAESADIRVKSQGNDADADTEWSATFTVEAGLLNKTDWRGARMIAADRPTEHNAAHRPILLRKEFQVGNDILSARLYITAFGLYVAYINGERVGDAVMAPGWQSYNHRLVYDTYDVTSLLQDGSNAIGMQVGEGWYAGRLGFDPGNRNIWGDTLGAMALLVIQKADGTSQAITTDLSWSSGLGPIITSDIYDGEVYDSSREVPFWNVATPGSPTIHPWGAVKELDSPVERLVAPDGPPIRRLEEVDVRQVMKTPSGATVIDFGQNLVGWLRVNVAGPAGTRIEMIHAESKWVSQFLQDGEIDTGPLRSARQTDTLILSGVGTQSWEPSFTYHGFRYVQVNNWPEKYTPLSRSSIKAVVLHSDMGKRAGEFYCSHELLNRLVKNVVWSILKVKGNFMSIPTDCPQRDERLGWTGDAHAFSATASFLYDISGFMRGWMRDVVAEQLESNNVVPFVVPNIPALGAVRPTSVWGDVVVGNAWQMYLASGDLHALRDQYVGAKAWVESGIPRGADGLWNHSYEQFGDWLDPKAPNEDPGAATTSSALVSDAYLVHITRLVATMASALGFKEDAARFQASLTKVTTAFQKAWINANGIVANETQTGLTLPLQFGLFPHGQDAAAALRLQKIIAANDYHVGTGFAGTHLLGLALTSYDLTGEFYKMLLQTTVPSWLYQVVQGGTTTWERWDSLLPNGKTNSNGMTSFNHYAFGSVANWMFQTIGGLAPASPGWKTVRVAPIPGGGLAFARASYLSPYGQVATHWEIDDDGVFELTLTVPPNSKAEVHLPGGDGIVQTVGSGRHTFKVSGVLNGN
ncbi:extracellular glycosyl hydrolase family 78 protein [Xylariaceae sp. FL1272]|nr:extracellular glycosyl hydrolase family 78 protein [Xylariaceae sp. FL1272]